MRFEVAKGYSNINLPVRKTANSAGYDFEVAERTVIPSYWDLYDKMSSKVTSTGLMDLKSLAAITKALPAKPTLVPTGIKCKLDPDTYLEFVLRSSCPLKYWLIMANSIGVIDADYYSNPDNDGAIFIQLINLSPWPIVLEKGDIIGQGIIKHYLKTEDDTASGERVGGFGSTG